MQFQKKSETTNTLKTKGRAINVHYKTFSCLHIKWAAANINLSAKAIHERHPGSVERTEL